jgi:ribokinase
VILVFGSINIDQVYQVHRHPAPGETLMGTGYLQVPGGKGGNQALAARRAGAEVKMIGTVGSDGNASDALSLLRQDGVDLSDVSQSDLPTGSASIWVDEAGENSIIVNSGANTALKADQVTKETLQNATYILLQMESPLPEICAVIEKAHENGVVTILNIAPYQTVPEATLKLLDFLIVNEVEAASLAGDYGIEANSEEVLAHKISEDFGLGCILTLGSRGVVAVKGERVYKSNTPLVHVVDTTAAGDCFAGCFAAALDSGDNFNSALHFATFAASLACASVGAQSSLPFKSDVKKSM